MFQPYFAGDDTYCKGRGLVISGNEESIASFFDIRGGGSKYAKRNIND